MFKSKIAAKLAAYFALAILVFAFVMAFSFGHFFRENFIARQQRALQYRAASVAAIMGDNLERSRQREANERRNRDAAAREGNQTGNTVKDSSLSGKDARKEVLFPARTQTGRQLRNLPRKQSIRAACCVPAG